MAVKRMLWATGIILLVTVEFVNCQNCTLQSFKKSPIICEPGTELAYERRQKFSEKGKTFYEGFCCVPGSAEEAEKRHQTHGCQVVRGEKAKGEKPCEDSLLDEFYVKGEKLIFDEIKREGDIVYCCQRDSLQSALGSVATAETHEFPHQAHYLRSSETCGATIYNKRWLILAGHCVVDHTGTGEPWKVDDSFIIKLGVNMHPVSNSANEYSVIQTVPYPDYSDLKSSPEQKKEKPRTYNDIALVQLNRDIEFGPYVKALTLAPAGFDENKYADNVVVVGWGRTDEDYSPRQLQKSNFVLHTDERCFTRAGAPHDFAKEYANKLFCIGGILDGVWSPSGGPGDSGGPAICRGADGTPVLCGVASYIGSTLEQCQENQDQSNCHPNVFTEVDVFRDWIKQVAGDQDESTLYKPQLYGEVLKANEVDHQVRITSSSGKPCGGTLIAPDTVVTAASCIAEVGGKMLAGLKVWSGVSDISTSGGNSHSVKSIKVLDGFKRNGDQVDVEKQKPRIVIVDNYYTNNLGVIKLNEPAKVGNGLPNLPQQNEEPSGPAMEYAFPRNTTRGGEMRRREFVLLDKKDCQDRWNHMGFVKMVKKVDDNVLCGVEKYSGGSICDRELGGGLICKGKDGKETLCGVQVQRLCEYSIPNDFINVGMHSNWLKSQ